MSRIDYTQPSNSTRLVLETSLASLEGGKYGVCYASGMAAVDAVFRMFQRGSHFVLSNDVYGGVIRLCGKILTKFGMEFTYVDTSDLSTIEPAIQQNTKMIWLETPSNPLMKVTDLEGVSRIAKKHNLLVGVDNTFATPYLLQPLEMWIDIVLHSTTKYISGHNQIIGGAVMTNHQPIFNELKFMQKTLGAIPSPLDCWLTLAGIKTLPLRMDRHSENGMAVAKFLEVHPKVSKVNYPGLKNHPNHDVAKRQMKAFSGMISFELEGGLEAGRILMNTVKLCSLAESLGAVETMITHPASMTHRGIPRELRYPKGLPDGLVRLSVGIEAIEDIISDLEQALKYV